MSNAKHTPGPWSANCSHIYAPDGAIIAVVHNPGSKAIDYPLPANRDLIAAAPDLLEALGELMEWEEEIAADLGMHTSSAKPMLAKAHAAIAKAKGGAK